MSETVRRTSFAAWGTGIVHAGSMVKRGQRAFQAGRILDCYAVVCVHAGSGRLLMDNAAQSQAIQAGDVFILQPERWHAYGPGAGEVWHEHFVVMRGLLFDALSQEGCLPPSVPDYWPQRPASWCRRFKNLVDHCRIKAGGQRSSAILHQLLLDGVPQAERPEAVSWLDAVLAQLDADVHIPIDMQSLARRQGLSYERFRKLFKACIGRSPGQYRLQRRLDKAVELLLAEDALPLPDIAEAVGFCDEFQFNRMFSRHRGCSPGRFREMH